jgi:hypothetical protein
MIGYDSVTHSSSSGARINNESEQHRAADWASFSTNESSVI